jgi:hypothetical protein
MVMKVSPGAVEQAPGVGLTYNIERRLRAMVALAAPITHTRGNRRFEDYVFQVENDEIVAVHLFSDGEVIPPRKKVKNGVQIIEDRRQR